MLTYLFLETGQFSKPLLRLIKQLIINQKLKLNRDNQLLLKTMESAAESKYSVGKGMQQEVFKSQIELSRLMNDENLAVKIGKAFLEDMPKQIDKLSDDLSSGDAAAAGHQAHKIRGASANVGGEAMRDAAIAMESAGASGDIESLKKLMPGLQREFELLKEAMEKL